MEFKSTIEGIGMIFSAFRQALGLVKDAKDTLPKSEKKEAIEKRLEELEEAEKVSKIISEKIAQERSYTIDILKNIRKQIRNLENGKKNHIEKSKQQMIMHNVQDNLDSLHDRLKKIFNISDDELRQ